jgi:hypothetical protein
MYDRHAVTKRSVEGKNQASLSASDLALKLMAITTVDGRRYELVKTLSSASMEFSQIPMLNTKFQNCRKLRRDKKAVERVKNHIRHLLTKDDERHPARLVVP